MKRIIKLSENDLTNIVKRVLIEQKSQQGLLDKIVNTVKGGIKTGAKASSEAQATASAKLLQNAYCDVKFGKITTGPFKGQMFCDVREKIGKIKPDLRNMTWAENCPNKNVFTLPEIPEDKKHKGWLEIFAYAQKGTDGVKLLVGPFEEEVCKGPRYAFEYSNPDGSNIEIHSDGLVGYRKQKGMRAVYGTWNWENNKPVFNLPITKKAVGYAETEEDIINSNKILSIGSKNDLVKRIQFEIMYEFEGKINPGCKPDKEGGYKPSLCDGVFGSKTKSGVRKFQIENGLKDKSGIVGAETWSAMNPFDINYEGVIFDQQSAK